VDFSAPVAAPLIRPAATFSPPPRKGEGALHGVWLASERLLSSNGMGLAVFQDSVPASGRSLPVPDGVVPGLEDFLPAAEGSLAAPDDFLAVSEHIVPGSDGFFLAPEDLAGGFSDFVGISGSR